MTIDPDRRLDQHNGKLPGGAIYTSFHHGWVYRYQITGFNTEKECLDSEHELDRKIRRVFSREARLRAFQELLRGPEGYGLTVNSVSWTGDPEARYLPLDH
jgi:hypothetical protein